MCAKFGLEPWNMTTCDYHSLQYFYVAVFQSGKLPYLQTTQVIIDLAIVSDLIYQKYITNVNTD